MALALCMLKPDYELQNRYLDNDFTGWTGIPADVAFDPMPRGPWQVTLNDEALFSINGIEHVYSVPATANTAFVLLFCGIICLGQKVSQPAACLISEISDAADANHIEAFRPAFALDELLQDRRRHGLCERRDVGHRSLLQKSRSP
jgi:hypothetical protein